MNEPVITNRKLNNDNIISDTRKRKQQGDEKSQTNTIITGTEQRMSIDIDPQN